jgi:hypothetical protein
LKIFVDYKLLKERLMAKATIFVLVLIALGIAAFLMYGDEINELIDPTSAAPVAVVAPTPAAPVAVEAPANPVSTKK